MARSASARPLSGARLAAFALLTPALLLTGIEGGARLREAPDAALTEEGRTPVGFQLLPEPLYKRRDLRMRIHEKATDTPVVLVSPKPKDELRVVVLGGSATAGWGLPPTASFVGLAERAVARAMPERSVRFVNLAKSGWGTTQIARQFRPMARAIEADLVLVIAGNNEYLDVANAIHLSGDRTRRVLLGRLLRAKLATARLLVGLMPRPSGVLDAETTPPMPNRWEVPDGELVDAYVAGRLDRNLRRIREAVPGVPVIVSTLAVNQQHESWNRPFWFLPQDFVELPETRQAILALQVGPARRGIDALMSLDTVGDAASEALFMALLVEADGRPEEAAEIVRTQSTRYLGLEVPQASPEDRVLRSIALRLTGVDPQQVQDELAQHPIGDRSRDCYTADVLHYAGARGDYSTCRRSAFYYRADATLNRQIRQTSREMGTRLLDLEALLDAHGTPGYDRFFDYCHYNPAGSALAGQAVAAAVLEELGSEASIPSPQEALDGFLSRWQGRQADPLLLEDWTGVDCDGPAIVFPRLDPNLPAVGDGAIAAVYRGNRFASLASPGQADPAEQARAEWAGARLLDPRLGPILDANEQLLRWLTGEAPLSSLQRPPPHPAGSPWRCEPPPG